MGTTYTSVKGLVSALVGSSKMSRMSVSRKMGRNESFVGNIIANKYTPKADTLNEIANACGYEMLFRRGDDEIVVTPPTLDDGLIG